MATERSWVGSGWYFDEPRVLKDECSKLYSLNHYQGFGKLHWGAEKGIQWDACCWYKRVELDEYQLKSVARTLFDQWKGGRYEDAPPESRACFQEAFLGHFFPWKMK